MALLSHGIAFCKRRFAPRCFLVYAASFTSESEIVHDNKEYPNLKTSECHPGKHTLADIGKYYEIPKKIGFETFFSAGIWPTEFKNQCSIFNEISLIIRKPGLEIIQYLKNADYSRPINKYLLYGKRGAGKTIILTYVLHYALMEGWLIVNVPWIPTWLNFPKAVKPSETMDGAYDIDLRATAWLNQFKILNLNLLSEKKFLIKNDYEWNSRESSKAGDTMLSIIEYGIMRGSFSSPVLVAVLEEIKLACRNNEMKCLVFIDGFNALFHSKSKLKDSERKMIPPEKISSLIAFKNMTLSDWHNGAAVLVCDNIAVSDYSDYYLPLHLLTLEGFEHIHPFIPIEVENFNDLEFTNVIAYYREKHWLNATSGDDYLKHLTGRNGFQLMKTCSSIY